MYWPGDTLIVSNVAGEAKRIAHPCSIDSNWKISKNVVCQDCKIDAITSTLGPVGLEYFGLLFEIENARELLMFASFRSK